MTENSETFGAAPRQDRFARLDTLGGEYSEAALSAVLAGEKAHKPRKKKVLQAEPKTVNLLVDIQAKLQAGKSAGYARWAKVFNLKQMAKTMNYLTENGLLDSHKHCLPFFPKSG